MEYWNPFPWLPGWNALTAECLMLVCLTYMVFLTFRRHTQVIKFTSGAKSWVRPVGFLLARLLVLHELVGWKFYFGLPIPMNWQLYLRAVGALILTFGFALYVWSLSTMKRHMTPPESKPARAQARLVTNGPYRFIRNPVYLSYLVIFFGAQVHAYSPLIVLAVPMWLTLRRWARTEEGIMFQLFGKAYLDYRRRTPAGL